MQELGATKLSFIEEYRKREYESIRCQSTTDENKTAQIAHKMILEGFSKEEREIVVEIAINPGISIKQLVSLSFPQDKVGFVVGALEASGMLAYLPPFTIKNFTDLRLYMHSALLKLIKVKQ